MLGSRAFRAQYPRSFCGIPLDMPWLPKPCLWSMWNHLKGMSQFVAPREQKKSCQTIQRPNKMFKVPFSTNLRMAAEGVRVPYPNQKIHSTTTNDLIVFFFVIHQCLVFSNLFQCPRVPSNNIASMSGAIKPDIPTMQAACPQTRICRPISA